MALSDKTITVSGIEWPVYMRGLEAITKTTVDNVPDFISKLYNIQHRKERTFKARTYAGLGEAATWFPDQGLDIPESTISTRYEFDVLHDWIGNSVTYTLDMKTFDRNDVMTKLATDLGNSIAMTRQKMALKTICDGFTGKWNTGATEPLFSASHALDSRAPAGKVGSNLVVGQPSVSTLSEAISLLVGTPDDLGNQGSYVPQFVLCHPTKYLEWKQIIGDDRGRSDTANNTINPFAEYHIGIVPCSYLDTENKWFLFGDKHGLVWNEVIGFKSAMETDAKTQVTRHLAYSCFARYIRDWRGIVGSQG